MKLKEFQRHTVAEVLLRLSRNGAYAIADETGLGKTMVCGDVARQLIERNPERGTFVIYYVAPSIELLDQNLDSIIEHLTETLVPADDFELHKVISRVTQIPLALAKAQAGRKNIFVIGLSPETSFRISGPGRMDERAYLAALFSLHRPAAAKASVAWCFWGRPGQATPEFIDRIGDYSKRETLGVLYAWRTTYPTEFQYFANCIQASGGPGAMTLKARRKLVTKIRKAVAAFLVRSGASLPNLVIFDEWHKYKATCFDAAEKRAPHEHLVAELLATLRKESDTKVLFVSATPFSVDYGDLHGRTPAVTSSDLKSLIQLFWDKDQFPKQYERLRLKQVAFVAAVEKLLKYGDESECAALKREAARCCRAYEAELRRYCVRTERPKVPPRNPDAVNPLAWDGVFWSGSAKQFLRRFSRLHGVRSPVTAMWMDGHTFPEAGYDGLRAFKLTNIPKEHWKIQHLQAKLKDAFTFGDGLHSLDRPPLWLWPEEPLRGRKCLIFSEFRFVPEEICAELKRLHSKVKSSASYSRSVLGFFPLTSGGEARVVGTKNLASSIHFPFFYPFLFWELEAEELAARIAQHREALDDAIAQGEDAVSLVLRVEEILVQGIPSLQQPMKQRHGLLRAPFEIRVTARFREYLTAILAGRIDGAAPGRFAARVVAQQRKRPSRGRVRHKAFEEKSLQIGQTLFHLFVSPEAQVLKKHAKVAGRDLPTHWNSFLRFALWYARRFQLQATLEEFANVLAGAGHDGLRVLTEIVTSMSVKRGSVGTKFIRSFHDRKADDASPETGTPVSTQNLRSAFNSPFAPYVLASTSVGQEGLDFHRYCDAIVHWTPPASPSVLRQREGRLDRFRSLQVRVALQAAERHGQILDAEGHAGLSPDFVVMHRGERLNRPHSEVFFLPYTAQQAAWRSCLERMYYDDLLIGAPDPLADERSWLNAVDGYAPPERAKRFSLLKEFSISLKPRQRRT